MSANAPFSLDRLEFLAYRGEHEAAALEMLKLLDHLNFERGGISGVGVAPTGDRGAEERDARFATRIASAIAALFSRPEFQLSQLGFQRLIPLQRWLSILFGASSLGVADHIIHVFNEQGYEKRDLITLQDRDLVKFALLYSLDSTIPLQPEVLWQKDKRLAAALFFAMLSSQIVATPEAYQKKEQLLEWLPSRLGEVSLDDIPVGIIHDVWMHCSYASGAAKHLIKRAINELVRKKLLDSGFSDAAPEPPPVRAKPVLMCVLEWFGSNHSIYRTHSVSMAALKSKYRLVGVSMQEASDEISRSIFDEIHLVAPTPQLFDIIRRVSDIAAKEKPEVIYYPSVGMFPETVFLMNLRLAPIQMIALGHPATTHSPFVDYVLVEEDYVGDPACFCEKLVALPRESIPYRLPANCPVIPPQIRKAPEPVRIAVAAAIMKINPVFLDTLRRIAETSKVAVEFHFFTSLAFGLGKVYLQNVVRRVLGDKAVMYPHLPYQQYLENINRCDMFVNPFPFGNTNGIVDTVRQGLAGVCLTGPEVHTHIDEGLFKRLGLPDWLVTRTPDEYVKATVRLAENSSEREKLARKLLKTNPDDVLFRGDPNLFVHAVTWLHENHAQLRSADAHLLRPPAGRR